MRKLWLAVLFLGLALPVEAELREPFRELHASDAAPGDLFGFAHAKCLMCLSFFGLRGCHCNLGIDDDGSAAVAPSPQH